MTIQWPTRKREDWRYTNTKPAQRHSFVAAAPGANGISRELLASWSLDGVAASLVFVNGSVVPVMSRKAEAAGLEVADLARDRVSGTTLEDAPLVAHNDALWTGGAHITVAKGAMIEALVELIFVHTEADRPTETHTRVLIEAGDGSAVTIVETHIGLGGQPALETAVTEIRVGAGANVRHVKVQRSSVAAYHFATLLAHQGRDSSFESHVVSLGSAVARTAVHVPMEQQGASCLLNGLYAAAGSQSLDHYTLIDHRVPHCTSTELYKGVVSDTAIGSFLGRVLMQRGAVGSATTQMARTLLLSDGAKAYTRPQLEIDNDDVTATHGCAIGSLDKDALFYLRSRGLDLQTARGLLVQGFVRELLDRLPVPALRETLATEVLNKLHTFVQDDVS